jgi:hypothetical protein
MWASLVSHSGSGSQFGIKLMEILASRTLERDMLESHLDTECQNEKLVERHVTLSCISRMLRLGT